MAGSQTGHRLWQDAGVIVKGGWVMNWNRRSNRTDTDFSGQQGRDKHSGWTGEKRNLQVIGRKQSWGYENRRCHKNSSIPPAHTGKVTYSQPSVQQTTAALLQLLLPHHRLILQSSIFQAFPGNFILEAVYFQPWHVAIATYITALTCAAAGYVQQLWHHHLLTNQFLWGLPTVPGGWLKPLCEQKSFHNEPQY